uniref:Uncharacterized protein n=1 Tax=Oryza sativa subsp. japonica TaxID=39947 RepID=Q5Z472_ORYSJ|nr:hypothetical protein [Oryza sativa Japonica Group]BAD62441.1 hypothetical protein [Oryza sativa Japonica Group]
MEDYWDGIQGYHQLPPTSDKSVEYTTNKGAWEMTKTPCNRLRGEIRAVQVKVDGGKRQDCFGRTGGSAEPKNRPPGLSFGR